MMFAVANVVLLSPFFFWVDMTQIDTVVLEMIFLASIPSAIGLLSTLVYLDLTYNRLTGTVPSELCLLTNLKTVYIYQNNALNCPSTCFYGDIWNCVASKSPSTNPTSSPTAETDGKNIDNILMLYSLMLFSLLLYI